MVLGIEQNFEIALDHARVEARIAEDGVSVRSREYRSLDWLGYHLRTLLHRNDALGMAASIEARFPYLDHDVVRAAVNMPYRYKIRPSFTTTDAAHPFLRDKWIVRKVAGRYIPRHLSERKKLGFPVNAYDRMRVASRIFEEGFVVDHYRLSRRELQHLMGVANREFLVRLLMLEVWGRLFFRDTPESEMVNALWQSVSINAI